VGTGWWEGRAQHSYLHFRDHSGLALPPTGAHSTVDILLFQEVQQLFCRMYHTSVQVQYFDPRTNVRITIDTDDLLSRVFKAYLDTLPNTLVHRHIALSRSSEFTCAERYTGTKAAVLIPPGNLIDLNGCHRCAHCALVQLLWYSYLLRCLDVRRGRISFRRRGGSER
jgi:hypothetical protein